MQPQFFGEPLVDKELGTRIKAAKGLGLKVSTFSNGSLLTEDKARMLIESGLDELKFSIDSHRPEVYEQIRKGLKFQNVLENVRADDGPAAADGPEPSDGVGDDGGVRPEPTTRPGPTTSSGRASWIA